LLYTEKQIIVFNVKKILKKLYQYIISQNQSSSSNQDTVSRSGKCCSWSGNIGANKYKC